MKRENIEEKKAKRKRGGLRYIGVCGAADRLCSCLWKPLLYFGHSERDVLVFSGAGRDLSVADRARAMCIKRAIQRN